MSNLTTLLNRDNQLAKSGEELGQFKPYHPELPIAEIVGTRIVKCTYRNREGSEKETRPNQYVRVPTKHLTTDIIKARIDDLAPYILDYLQEVEDRMIKDDHKKGVCQLFTQTMSLEKLIQILDESSLNGRLNGEMIGQWFDNDLQTNLMLTLAEKLGFTSDTLTDTAEAKITMLVNVFRNKYISLASPKTVLKEQDRDQLLKALDLLDIDSAGSIIASKIKARIDAMSKNTNDALEALL